MICLNRKMLSEKHLFNFLFILALSSLSVCCKNEKKDPNLAGVKHFYFEFVDNVQSELTKELIQSMTETMPEFDYLMSEETASKGWPFYGPVKRGSRVLKTDMMPPHSNVNRLSPISKLKNYNQGEHTMKALFTIIHKDDHSITITEESFEWSDGEWHQFSKKLFGDYDIASASQEELAEAISKTLIRYTFK